MDWFSYTHQCRDGAWYLAQLPLSGGLCDQDARLMAALRVIRSEANAVLQEQHERERERAETERWRKSLK